MPGTTPDHSFPYPLPSDSINVPRDIQALAEAVDAAWQEQITPIVVKATEPTAADFGLPTIPVGAVWIVSP